MTLMCQICPKCGVTPVDWGRHWCRSCLNAYERERRAKARHGGSLLGYKPRQKTVETPRVQISMYLPREPKD